MGVFGIRRNRTAEVGFDVLVKYQSFPCWKVEQEVHQYKSYYGQQIVLSDEKVVRQSHRECWRSGCHVKRKKDSVDVGGRQLRFLSLCRFFFVVAMRSWN